MGGWVGGGVAKHSLFCCMIARICRWEAQFPQKELRTHTRTPPVGLSQSPNTTTYYHCCKINNSNPVSSWMRNTHEKQFPHPWWRQSPVHNLRWWIIFSLLLLSCSLQQLQQQQLANLSVAQKQEEKRREERRIEERITPTRLCCSIFLILLCCEVHRSFSSTGELCLFTVFHILTSLASWWCMSPKQSGRVFFAVCLFILGVSRRIAEFHDGSRTLRVIFCHPHCELCLNLFLSCFCCESSFWFQS